MGKVRIKLNLKGINEVMKSAEVQELLDSAAQQIAAAAGDGYEIEPAKSLRWIGLADVHAATPKAVRDNSENNTLLKAAGGVHV